jgi:hypothetical protein
VQTQLAGEAIRVLGAEPVPMPMGQLALAIANHVVDGCVDPWHLVPPLRLNDLLKAHTEFSDLSLSSTSFVLAMNKDVYARLPRDLMAVIDRNSGQVAAGMAGAMWDVQAAAVANDVAQRGDVIVTLLPEAVAHWRKATEPVVDSWLKDMKEKKVDGGKLLASVHALLTKYANEPEPQPQQTAPPAEQEIVTQPEVHPEAKADATTMPKMDRPAVAPPAPAAPAPIAKPAPPSGPAPHIAARTPAPTASVTTPTPPTAPAVPAAKPVAAPPPTVAAAPSAPTVVTPPAIAAPPAPVVTPIPAPAPPIPKPVPAAVSPPKTLNIPL